MSYSWADDTGSSSSRSERSGGYDYSSARAEYDRPRSSSTYERPKETPHESRPVHDFRVARGATPHPVDRSEIQISTDSTHPIVVCVDHTGSFKTEVGIVLEKMPLLGKEVERYTPDATICFSIVGDTTSDAQPLQVRDFDKGEPLDAHIKALFPEGGGGDSPESYDLAAYYFTNHCVMSAAVKPLFIWVLDSDTRAILRKSDIKRYIGDTVQEDLKSVDVLKQLATKFTVYVILKGTRAHTFWSNIYGEQNIISMDEPRDIIELIIGIVAGEAGEYADFADRSSARHSDRPDRVSRVMRSTRSCRDASERSMSGTSMRSGTTPDGTDDRARSMRSRKLV